MSSRSLLLQLPRDILHGVYSEWLPSWQDLSCLDVACVEKEDREAWLCSLNEVRLKSEETLQRLSEESTRKWYEWLFSRKVLVVERFPMPLSVFADLATPLDFGSYCPSIRSIDIKNDFSYRAYAVQSSELSLFGERLCSFVRECVCLEELRIHCGSNPDVRDLILSALIKGLKANTLVRICINFWSRSISTVNMIRQLLANHLSSVHDIEFSSRGISEESVDRIMSILHEKTTPLKKLCLHVDYISLFTLSRFLSCGAVMQLEVLSIITDSEVNKEDLFSYLSEACPRMRTLILKVDCLCQPYDQFPVRKLLKLYESCPDLISFIIYDFSKKASVFVEVNADLHELCYDMQRLKLSIEEKEMFLECMRLALERNQCKLTVSNKVFCYNLVKQYDDWVLFKSKLSPYLTDLNGEMSESILIEAVKELPRLQKLSISLEKDKLSDLSLGAIMEYGYDLKTLSINGYTRYRPLCSFSDEMISKVIRSCKRLKKLEIPCAGYESLLAVKYHPRLREVVLDDMTEGKIDVSTLLWVDEREGEEKRAWKRLRKGEIYGVMWIFNYNKEKRCWE
eukprot:scaffold386_cov174-Ochromonas_danica.AAC.7